MTRNELDAEGLFIDRPGTITTYSGLRVDPLAMNVEDIAIEDIARALSRQCRYNGHVGGFLSVARHSIMVSEHLAPRGRMFALWGLLHDAAEAYLGDLVRPLKHGDFGKLFIEHEEKLEAVVAAAFDLPFPMPPEVKEADSFVLNEYELAGTGDGTAGMRAAYKGDPDEDERAFLDAYASIVGGKRYERTIIIGLHGAKRVGKDSVGRVLVERLDFVRRSFADKLYATLLATDPFVPVQKMLSGFGKMDGYTEYQRLSQVVERDGWEVAKDTIPEVRRLLEKLGTEGVRVNLGTMTWIDAAMTELHPGVKYVYTDVRFANEAQAIIDAGGEVWRVTRPGFEPDNSHASNAGIPDALITRTITNDGTRSDLRRAVLAVWTPA